MRCENCKSLIDGEYKKCEYCGYVKSKSNVSIIDKNVKIEVLNGQVFLHMKKHQPVIISSSDKYRKGIEFDICSKCKVPSIIQMWAKNRKKYCSDCTHELIRIRGE